MPSPDKPAHYENFPVASLLLPANLRPAVRAIYAFARTADDYADEDDLSVDQRLNLLDAFRTELERCARGEATELPLFRHLGTVIAAHRLPVQPFHDLLDAFRQDVTQQRYDTFDELMDYCRRSANPVGRLLLHLFRAATPENLERADAVCSALQLINHWQDVGIDLGKGSAGRIYLPREDLARFGVSEATLQRRHASADFRALMRFEVARARALMHAGASLGSRLSGRIGLEIRTIIAAGLALLDKIEAVNYDVFAHRPTLGPLDWPRVYCKAFFLS